MSEDDRRDLAELRAQLNALRHTLNQLDVRLAQLEQPEAPAAAPAPSPPPSATPVAEPVGAPPPRRGPPLRAGYRPRERRPREPTEFERRFNAAVRTFFTQGNLLNKVGALTLLLSATLFYSYAVDNNWIGPTGRVAIGILVGIAFFGAGEYYQRHNWKWFASGLVGVGNGLLFLSIFFAQQRYDLIPAGAAFFTYVLVTAAAVTQALRYNALGLALWGLLGGYLTPWLASTGEGQFVVLSCYLLVLNSGVFAIAYRRDWQPLKWMAFLLTEPYLFVWVVTYLEHPHATRWLELHWLLPFLWVFFAYFAAIPTWRSLLVREPIDRFGQLLTVLNGVSHFAMATMLLYDDHRWWLGIAAVIVTVIYVVLLSQVAREPVVDTRAFVVFAGTAAGFLLLATPFLARREWITLVWCAETAFIAWACTQPRFAFLRFHVLAMLALIAGRLVFFDDLFEPRWVDPERTYIPFAHLKSYPPFAAAAAFAVAGRYLGRLRNLRLPYGWIVGLGVLALIAGIDSEAYRVARFLFVPHATSALADLVQAGLLVAVMAVLYFGVFARAIPGGIPWLALMGFTALLTLWVIDVLLWPVSYLGMTHILGEGYGLWWLHGGTLLLLGLLALAIQVARTVPGGIWGLEEAQVRAACYAAAVIIAMFLLRREIFAVTHAPPVADLFPDTARRASYRMLLSVCYTVLAFGIYVSGVRRSIRARLYTAYALYIFTGLKVAFNDIESRNQIYIAATLAVFGAILIISSYAARRYTSAHA